MAINKLENLASVTYNGVSVLSNTAETLLLLSPLIVKSVDMATAIIGDTITYTIVITNLNIPAITNLPFRDALPAGSLYVDGSFTLNGTSQTPVNTANVLTYTIPSIASLGVATITFQATVTGV